jgi:hypothetical protein
MLILTPTVALEAHNMVEVKPKESKMVGTPSIYEFNQIHVTQLPYSKVLTVEKTREPVPVVEPKPVAVKKLAVKKISAEDKRNAKIKQIASKIDNQLEGKLADKGAVFAEAAVSNDVDPYLVAAISIHETGNGDSKAIHNKNNVGGMMGSNGLKRFSSVNESIQTLSELIKNRYVDKGLDTIQEISEVYAPIGADNDPNGLNHAWVESVSAIYNKLKSNSM